MTEGMMTETDDLAKNERAIDELFQDIRRPSTTPRRKILILFLKRTRPLVAEVEG